jgi:predicted nicotinamide N-methyase
MLAFLNACNATGASVLVGDPQRAYFPKDRFEAVAEYRVPVTRELEDAEIKNAAVWRLRA